MAHGGTKVVRSRLFTASRVALLFIIIILCPGRRPCQEDGRQEEGGGYPVANRGHLGGGVGEAPHQGGINWLNLINNFGFQYFCNVVPFGEARTLHFSHTKSLGEYATGTTCMSCGPASRCYAGAHAHSTQNMKRIQGN